MAYGTSTVKRGVKGDLEYVTFDLNPSSLSNDGYESFHPSVVGIKQPVGMTVLGKETGGYVFNWDHVNEDRVEVFEGAASGSQLTAVASGTDVGEVRVEFQGER